MINQALVILHYNICSSLVKVPLNKVSNNEVFQTQRDVIVWQIATTINNKMKVINDLWHSFVTKSIKFPELSVPQWFNYIDLYFRCIFNSHIYIFLVCTSNCPSSHSQTSWVTCSQHLTPNTSQWCTVWYVGLSCQDVASPSHVDDICPCTRKR